VLRTAISGYFTYYLLDITLFLRTVGLRERIETVIYWHLLKKTVDQDIERLSFYNTTRLAVSGLSVSEGSLYSATGCVGVMTTLNAGLSASEQSIYNLSKVYVFPLFTTPAGAGD